MEPATFDLNLYRGDSYGWQFKFYEDEAKTVPTDLAGATVAAEIRDKSAGPVVCLLETSLVDDANDNIVQVEIQTTHWTTMPASKGVWDLQITMPDGRVITPVKGIVLITADVTDSGTTP
jgi:hypothetical protein